MLEQQESRRWFRPATILITAVIVLSALAYYHDYAIPTFHSDTQAETQNKLRSPRRCSFVSLRGRPTGQITTGWGGPASRAVDGNVNRHWGGRSCTHTHANPNPWWFVDVGAKNSLRRVCTVQLYNRRDCCQARLTKFRIFVTNRRPIPGRPFHVRPNEICAVYPGTRPFQIRAFACRRRLRGRFVGVQLMKRDYLTLCEVKIAFGKPIRPFRCVADPREGSLIKSPNRSPIFQIFGGKKHWIPNPRTFHNIFKRSTRVVTSSCLNTVPTGQSYSNGARLIKCAGLPHIFLHTNGQKRWICNPSSYNQFNFAWNKVRSLSMAQCRRICNGPIICNSIRGAMHGRLLRTGPFCRGKPADGTLFKCPRSSAVYQQIDGEKQHVPNPATFTRLYGNQAWKKILTYPQGYCRQVESGLRLSTNAKLIKCGRYPHIFLLSNQSKRWICNPRAYYMYHYRFGKVHRVRKSQCKKICLGQPLCLSVAAERREPARRQVHSLEPKNGCGSEE